MLSDVLHMHPRTRFVEDERIPRNSDPHPSLRMLEKRRQHLTLVSWTGTQLATDFLALLKLLVKSRDSRIFKGLVLLKDNLLIGAHQLVNGHVG